MKNREPSLNLAAHTFVRHGWRFFSGHDRRIGWRPCLRVVIALIAISMCRLPVVAAAPDDTAPIRELYVPFEDLPSILSGANERIFMPRSEFDLLRAAAETKPATLTPPRDSLMTATDYEIRIADGFSTIVGLIDLDIMTEGTVLHQLDLNGVGIRQATLDEAPAAMAVNDKGLTILVVEGIGRHRLRLEMSAAIESKEAQQMLHCQLPTASSNRMRLEVQGNVEVKSGASILDRTFDDVANTTRFEIVPPSGPMTIVVSLNNKQLRDKHAVAARSVMVTEVTQTSERLVATFSMNVLNGGAEQFRFLIPPQFEVQDVQSPQLLRWNITNLDKQPILNVVLREMTTQRCVIGMTLTRSRTLAGSWEWPRIEPLDVVGHVAILGLRADSRLEIGEMETQALIAIDDLVFDKAISSNMQIGGTSIAPTRLAGAFYAPFSQFDWKASFTSPVPGLATTTSLVLRVRDGELELLGGVALSPTHETIFALDLVVPKDWQIIDVTLLDGTRLQHHRYENDGMSRVHLSLASPIRPMQRQDILFTARHTPPGWLDPWEQKDLEFPKISVLTATKSQFALTVQTDDDLKVEAIDSEKLTPLFDNEKPLFRLENVASSLAYQTTDEDWKLSLQVTKTESRMLARWYSFFTFRQEELIVHYEAAFDVESARAKEVSFSLPSSTPAEIAINGIGDVAIKETSSALAGDRRIWKVKLAKSYSDKIGLSIDFQQSLKTDEPKMLDLPQARAESVAYQSGMIAIEGSPDLEFQITKHPPIADVGQLVDAKHQVGKHLLGTYEYLGVHDAVTIHIQRRLGYKLPSTIVKRAEMTTILSEHGISQTAARFLIQSKDDYVEIKLPPESQLWSIVINGIPSLPQLDGNRLVVEFPKQGKDSGNERDLQIVYQLPIAKMKWRSPIDVSAPRLVMRHDGLDAGREVPLAHVRWHLFFPKGNKLVETRGNVFSDRSIANEWSLTSLANCYSLLSASAKDERPAATPAYESVDAETDQSGAKASEPPRESQRASGAQVEKEFSASVKQAFSTWALAGVRSLPIEIQLDDSFEDTSFTSLGDNPRLSVTFIAHSRSQFATWLTGLLVFVGGIRLMNHPAKSKWRYLFVILACTLLLPSLSPWSIELSPLCTASLVAVGMLLLLFAVAGCAHWTSRFWRLRPMRASAAALPKVAEASSMLITTAVFALSGFHVQVFAQPSDTLTPEKLMSFIEALPSKKPITIPSDTVVIPYRTETRPSARRSSQPDDELWVAMPTYVELWNRAHPQQPLPGQQLPIAWAWRGLEYAATIEEDAHVSLRGQLQIELFSNAMQSIPLPIQGGVLKRATLDDRAAHLKDDGSAMQILVSRQGIHSIGLEMRFPIQKQGGWRLVEGRIPVAPASQITWTIPNAGTEVRLPGMIDRIGRETAHPNEAFSVPVANDGTLAIHWRPKVAETTLDQDLASDSTILFDAQEDSLKFVWKAQLAFRSGRRDSFRFEIPPDYLVERVTGSNIRGWNVDQDDDRQRVNVQLLKAVAERESLTIIASRRSTGTNKDSTEFEVPVCSVEDAMVQQGTFIIRRSSLLDIRTLDSRGLTRRDIPESGFPDADATADESPLGLRVFQAFRFSTVPYSMTVAVAAISSRATVETQTLLRLSTRESRVETRLVYRVADSPLYELKVLVPDTWDIERPILPIDFEWSMKPDKEGWKLIDIHLKRGQRGEFSLILLGRSSVSEDAARQARFAIPEIEVLNVARQEGSMVIQTDPGFDVRTELLKNCDTAMMSHTDAWLLPQQRTLARTAIKYRGVPYSGVLQLVPRLPIVNGMAISNVKVTDLAIEETVYIDWTIRDAGIHQISFTLPAWMSEARVHAPLIQRVTKTPLDSTDKSPIQFVLDLQDDVIGQYRVVIENDRPLESGTQLAPIPTLTTGVTDQRFVTLENVGHDELVIGKQEAVLGLDRLQSQWKTISDLLGGKSLQAFSIREGSDEPRLEYATKDRTKVETAEGRIGLAQTLLIIDEAGAYRASQEYRVENRTEPYLEIEIPSGASLWTVEVAGEPVKPIQVAADSSAGNNLSNATPSVKASGPHRVRLPLVKTDEGELDYGVMVKYGGRLNVPNIWNNLQFPLIRTTNINVELSQVRILVPESRRWFRFNGTLREVHDRSDFAVGWLSFKNKQIEQLTELISSRYENSFSKSRATANLKSLTSTIEQNRSSIHSMSQFNSKLHTEILRSAESIEKAQTTITNSANVDASRTAVDNRLTLKGMSTGQLNGRANNIVGLQTNNFQVPSSSDTSGIVQQVDPGDKVKGPIATTSESQIGPTGNMNNAFYAQPAQVDGRLQDPNRPSQPSAIDLGNSAQAQSLSKLKRNEEMKVGQPDKAEFASQALRYQQAIEKKQLGDDFNDFAVGSFSASAPPFGRNAPQASASEPLQHNRRSGADPTAGQTDIDSLSANDRFANGQILLGGSIAARKSASRSDSTGTIQPELPVGYRASLSVDLTERGREYLFTTPRGNIELSARSVTGRLEGRVLNVGLSVLVLGCLWYAPRLLQFLGSRNHNDC